MVDYIIGRYLLFLLPSGKLSHNYGKSPFLMGKSTISMAIFNIAMFAGTKLGTRVLSKVAAGGDGTVTASWTKWPKRDVHHAIYTPL